MTKSTYVTLPLTQLNTIMPSVITYQGNLSMQIFNFEQPKKLYSGPVKQKTSMSVSSIEFGSSCESWLSLFITFVTNAGEERDREQSRKREREREVEVSESSEKQFDFSHACFEFSSRVL